MESNLKYLREQRHMTQQQLGDILGLSQQIVSRMELDRNKIQVDVLIQLAELFHVSTDYVLGYETDDGNEESVAFITSDGEVKTTFVNEAMRLEQLSKSERMKIWKKLVELKRLL